jgi:hypothetical protein
MKSTTDVVDKEPTTTPEGWIERAIRAAVVAGKADQLRIQEFEKAAAALRTAGVEKIGRKNICPLATRFHDGLTQEGTLAKGTIDNYLSEFRRAVETGKCALNTSRGSSKTKTETKTLEATIKDTIEGLIEKVQKAEKVSFSATNMIKHLTSALALVK